jgi:hypothetical protein
MEPLEKLAETVADLLQQDPWYDGNVVNLVFESYVLDVIDELPQHLGERVQKLSLHQVFDTRSETWQEALAEVLQFSDTLNVAILDAWYRLLEINDRQGGKCDPVRFARSFVERFFAENSDVDVWTPDTLEEARRRIERIRAPGP